MNKKFLQSVFVGIMGLSLSLATSCSLTKKEANFCGAENDCAAKKDEAHKCAAKKTETKKEAKKSENDKCSTDKCSAKKSKAPKK